MKKLLSLLLWLACLSCSNEAAVEQAPRPATAAANVTVLSDSLPIPGLDRKRLLRVYVPPGYDTSARAYPVLYMHDGQNLFDDATSYVGEWGVDEILNDLAASGTGPELIVVGIDNGQALRMNEMSPWTNEEYGAAEGEEYVSFIVRQVKPLIDSTYRTLPAREHTGIMGSSMGGLISQYAVYEYPEVFGKAGIFSPSYWFAEDVFDFTAARPVPQDTRLFLLVGEKEGAAMAPDSRRMNQYILATGHPEENLHLTVDPVGTHSEGFWRENFGEAVTWLFVGN